VETRVESKLVSGFGEINLLALFAYLGFPRPNVDDTVGVGRNFLRGNDID
jgi:hypothetical protein